MRAISQTELGGPEVLREVERPRPDPGPTEVLVRVRAAGVNPVDWKTRSIGGFFGEPPFVLGFDVSGVVEEIGFGVTRFEVGDEVFGMPLFPREVGAYAEYVTAPSRHFARKPAQLSHEQAAALPLAALTAYQALVHVGGLSSGQRVLIHAAAGGVGHLAVQIAKSRGAWVCGTARAEKHDFLRKLGADELVDYTTTDFAERVRDVDVVLDPICGDYAERSLRTLRSGGIHVPILAPPPDLADRAKQLGVRTSGSLLVEPDRADMEAIAELAGAGQLAPEVAAVFPLEQAATAHEQSETGRIAGKIVLTV